MIVAVVEASLANIIIQNPHGHNPCAANFYLAKYELYGGEPLNGVSYGSEFTPFFTSAPFIYDHWPIPVRRMTSHYLSYRRKLFFVSDKWLLGEVLVLNYTSAQSPKNPQIP